MFSKPIIHEQKRANGDVFYFASVEYRGRWLWGLVPYKTTWHVAFGSGPYLSRFSELGYPFKFLNQALQCAREAVSKKEAEISERVVSYRRIEVEQKGDERAAAAAPKPDN